MVSNRYRYYGLDQIDLPRDERGYYQHFAVYRGEECVVEFYVNKDFEGMFYQSLDGTYHQTAGTCQYTFPHSSKSVARRELRRIALQTEKESRNMPSDEELAAYFNSSDFNNDWDNLEQERQNLHRG